MVQSLSSCSLKSTFGPIAAREASIMENFAPASLKRFEIGIAEIDAQHRRLFELLNDMKGWSGTDLEHAASLDILDSLSEYALVHFAVEESIMRMLHYPDTAAHIAEHKRFADTLDVFRHRLLKEQRSIDLVDFIKSWLVDHIDRVDRQYVDYFLAKGVEATAFS
jgi:hemerythrin